MTSQRMTEYLQLQVFKTPLCLIETDHSGKLSINTETLDQIKCIKHKLNIVTIVGLYRTGKSYLLNRLAGFNKGFPLGSTINAQTKGIWVWCRNHPVHDDQVLVLMDTEGLGDVSKGDKNHDNQLFTLAVLLSSSLVYNTLGIFQEEDLEKLSFVTEISNYMKMRENGEQKDDREFFSHFPMFIVALRDFTLKLEMDGRQITPDEYLEKKCLRVRKEKDEKDRKYNQPRLCILKYFKTRKCFTFDRPAPKSKLCKLEEVKESELSADFRSDCEKFVAFVHSSSLPKQLDNGHIITGRMFQALFETYVEAIRTGSVPCVENAFNTMAERENRTLVEEGYVKYKNEMKKVRLPASDENTLPDTHYRSLKIAITYFMERSIYDKDENYQKELNTKILAEYNKIQIDNESASIKYCEGALKLLNRKIEDKLRRKIYLCAGGYAVYTADLKELECKYRQSTGLGCKKEETLATFLQSKLSELDMIQEVDTTLTEKDRAIHDARKIEELQLNEEFKLKQQLQTAQKRIAAIKFQMEENVKQLERKREHELRECMHFYQNQIDELERQKESLDIKYDEYFSFYTQEFQMLQKRLRDQDTINANTRARYEKLLQEFRQENEYLQEELSAENERRSSAIRSERYERQTQVEALKAELEHQQAISSMNADRVYKLENELWEKKNDSSCILS